MQLQCADASHCPVRHCSLRVQGLPYDRQRHSSSQQRPSQQSASEVQFPTIEAPHVQVELQLPLRHSAGEVQDCPGFLPQTPATQSAPGQQSPCPRQICPAAPQEHPKMQRPLQHSESLVQKLSSGEQQGAAPSTRVLQTRPSQHLTNSVSQGP